MFFFFEIKKGDNKKKTTFFFFIKRLYIKRKEPEESDEPDEIGYFDFLPEKLSKNNYENFSDTLKRLNDYLKSNPLPGRIINIEDGVVNRDRNDKFFMDR